MIDEEITRRLAELVATSPAAPDISAAMARGKARRRNRRAAALAGTAAAVGLGSILGVGVLHPASRGGELVITGSGSSPQPSAPASTHAVVRTPPSPKPSLPPRPRWTKGQVVPFTLVLAGSHLEPKLEMVNWRMADGRYLNGGPDFVPGNTPQYVTGPGDAEQQAEIGFSNGVATAISVDSYYQVVYGIAPAGTGDIIVRGDIGSVRTHPLPVPGTNIRAWVVPAVGVVSPAAMLPATSPPTWRPDWIIAQ